MLSMDGADKVIHASSFSKTVSPGVRTGYLAGPAGRIKELIIKGGENIAPREIDEALLAHPAVLDAAAVGMPDRHYGQDILACVVLHEGTPCSEEALRAFCVERLGPFKTPKVFRFVSDLPRGPSGKVQRLKLLDIAKP